MDILTMAVGLAVLVESLTEYIGGIWWEPGANGNRLKVMSVVALTLGILVALVFQVDLVKALGIASPLGGIPGQVLTGIILSRGADFTHSIFKRMKPS